MSQITVREDIKVAGFEQVVRFYNPDLDIVALVAIHSTSLGPALGGCRINKYDSETEALADVLRLAEGMSYKNSLCGINFGGGKSVIIAERDLEKNRTDLFAWFGECVQSLAGKYVTAEDMGTRVSDMNEVARHTSFVSGRPQEAGGGGDPSPYTALGVFEGIKACLSEVFGSDSLADKKIAIQGVGNVGFHLAQLLHDAGAKLFVSDVSVLRLNHAQEQFGATVVPIGEIQDIECDVFAPCARGGVVTKQNVSKLRCKIIAGGANNVFFEPELERVVADRGILYAPDFAINPGGVILCASEFEPSGYTDKWVRERVLAVRQTIARIFLESRKRGKLPREVALELAQERISSAKK